ncbi:putative major capsid protein [Candidatus Hepatincola sp. Pdp]
MLDVSDLIKEGFNHAVTLNVQQKGTKLANCVRLETQSVERYFYDQIAPTEAQDVTSRHADTPLIQTKFDRRMVTLITSDWGDLIDREDQLKLLADPTSAYALNAAYALGRRQDQHIIDAALGDANSGAKGETKVALPDSQKISVTEESKDTGLTIAKLRKARLILDDADVDDSEEQYCILSAKQVSDLLTTTEVTSEDYNTVKALVDGKVNTFMGFNIVRISSSLLPIDDNNNRTVICFAKSGIVMGSLGKIKTDITTRADKRMATQVYASLSCGATRMIESKVVSIMCKE